MIFALISLLSKGLIEKKRLKIGLLLPFSGRRPMGINAAGAVTLALERQVGCSCSSHLCNILCVFHRRSTPTTVHSVVKDL